MKSIVLAACLAGCASAGSSDAPADAPLVTLDSVMIDMPPPPMQKTLSQTTSNAVEAQTARACSGSVSGTAANNYYRVFDLSAFGITKDFAVTKVSFQIEHCHEFDSSAGADVTVRVGTYDGTPGQTLTLANMTVLESVTAHVPEVIESGSVTPGGTVDAALSATIPAGSKLFVEVDAPDGNASYAFYMGSNNDGETGFGYILAPACSISVPTNVSSVGTPAASHMLLTVTGTY